MRKGDVMQERLEQILEEFKLKEDIVFEMIKYVEDNKNKINILFQTVDKKGFKIVFDFESLFLIACFLQKISKIT